MMPLLLRRRWSLTLADQLLLAWRLSMRLTLFASCCLRAAILSVSDRAPWSWLMGRWSSQRYCILASSTWIVNQSIRLQLKS